MAPAPGSVFVVMIRVCRVTVAVMEVVDVVAVLHRLVAAVRPVLVKGVIFGGGMQIGDIAFVVVISVLMVGVSVVEVVHVVAVLHRGVSTGCCVGVRVISVNCVRHLSAPVRG